jgi:hypothetical protein
MFKPKLCFRNTAKPRYESKCPFLLCTFCVSHHNTCKNNITFSWKYICVFYPIHQSHIQIQHKMVCCCHLKYYQLEFRGGGGGMVFIYNFLTPLLSLCVHTISRQYHGAAHLDTAALAIPKNLVCDPPDGHLFLHWSCIQYLSVYRCQ